jgi:hypothetical protein
MVKKTSKWNNTCKRFVAFLDIMGFKDMILRKSHEDVKKILEPFSSLFWAIEKIAHDSLSQITFKSNSSVVLPTEGLVRSVIFSDSIILVSIDDSKDSFVNLLATLGWVLKYAFINIIPIKGAIAYGDQTADFNRSLHFGRPLIDAFELQKELQLYGVILHHTMEKRLSELNIINNLEDKYIFKYPVPMKSGKINHLMLDWTGWSSKDESLKLVTRLYNSVSGAPRLYVDNSLDYVKWVFERIGRK